jgi:DNA-binding transcriptional ArsR family regulator
MNLSDLESKSCEAEAFLKSIANRYRLMILCDLHKGERSVSALRARIGLSQSALSQHLARLRTDRLVRTRRDGQMIFYSLGDPNVSRVIGLLYEIYCAAGCAPKINQRAGQADP